MMTPIDAADQIRQYARQFKAMSDIADTLQRVGSLEQAIAECEKQVTAARSRRDAEIAAIDAEIDEARKRQAAAESQSDAMLRAANADADEIKQAAHKEAERIKTMAQAAKIEADAYSERIKSEARGAEAASLAKLASFKGEILAAEERLRTTTIEAERAEGRLAECRRQIAKMMGG